MKIGQFALQGQISKDTARYYVEQGLLIPKMSGPQMDFTQREVEDLQYIQRLKQDGFNLKEIYSMLGIRRTMHLIEPGARQDYLDILQKKQEDLQKKIVALQSSVRSIEREMDELKTDQPPRGKKLGVPLKALEYLVCPKCGGAFQLQNSTLSSRYIYTGDLVCSCGHCIKINKGIVVTGNLYTDIYDSFDPTMSGLYDDVGDHFVTYFQKCHDFVFSRMQEISVENKVVLEANIDGYFFAYPHLSQLKSDCLYIVIDKFEETLLMYKNLIEQMDLDLNLLFIADASVEYPLKPNCIDLFINFFGDDEFFLYHQNSFVHEARRYLKPETSVIGAFMNFDAGSKSQRMIWQTYPGCSQTAFCKQRLIAAYEKEGYAIRTEEIGKMVKTYQKFRYACHMDGEFLHLNIFEARKKNRP